MRPLLLLNMGVWGVSWLLRIQIFRGPFRTGRGGHGLLLLEARGLRDFGRFLLALANNYLYAAGAYGDGGCETSVCVKTSVGVVMAAKWFL
jgi:hypothetical protein